MTWPLKGTKEDVEHGGVNCRSLAAARDDIVKGGYSSGRHEAKEERRKEDVTGNSISLKPFTRCHPERLRSRACAARAREASAVERQTALLRLHHGQQVAESVHGYHEEPVSPFTAA